MKKVWRKTVSLFGGGLFLVITTSLACASPRPYSISLSNFSCERAQQLARQVVGRLGYAVTSITPASQRTVGVIRGARKSPHGEDTVAVHIACGADGVQVEATPDLSPCDQANHIARHSVERLGYAVSSFIPAVNEGRKGLVKGTREISGVQETVALTITCTDEVVHVDTRSDNPVVASTEFTTAITDFRRGFFALFKPLAEAEQRKDPHPSHPRPP
jgi:hypothetical protein